MLAIALSCVTVTGTLIAGTTSAAASGPAITVSTSASSVAPSSTIDLTAAAPVAQAGSTTQEITQVIDPTKVKLTALSDITYPVGWTLSYCSGASTDCTVAGNFSSTTPANATAWANVKAIKATGSIDSQGESAGYQLAAGTANGSAVRRTPATIPASGTGDGYQVFFDPGYTRVFNVFHHNSSTGQIDCHVISTGATCAGFPYRAGVTTTNQYSMGRVVGTKIWMPGFRGAASAADYAVGFSCVDISAVLASGGAPALCSTPFVPLATGASVSIGGDNALRAIRSIDGVSTGGSSLSLIHI